MKEVIRKLKNIMLEYTYRMETTSKTFCKKNSKKIRQFKETLTSFKAFIGLIFGQLKKVYNEKSTKN